MATTSRIGVTEGSGKYAASYSISEDAVTKELQRIVLANNAGSDIADTSGRIPATLATVLSALTDKIQTFEAPNIYVPLTVTGLVYNATGVTLSLKGIFVSSFTGTVTVKFWDNIAGSGPVLIDTYTIGATGWVPMGNPQANTGIYATISGTCSITVMCNILS